MKKSILSILALAAVFASCTKNEVSAPIIEGDVAIVAKSNALDISTRLPFEGQIATDNELTARIIASKTSATYADAGLYADGTMTFEDNTSVFGYDAAGFTGSNFYPANDDMLYFVGLFPATGWINNMSDVNRKDFVFDGSQDVMATSQKSSKKSTATTAPPSLVFEHKLTKLTFKVVAEDQAAIDAWGKINKIVLSKYKGTTNFPNKLGVTALSTGTSALDGMSTVSAFDTYVIKDGATLPEYTDFAFDWTSGVSDYDQVDLTETLVPVAYSIVAPMTHSGTLATPNFHVTVFAEGYKNAGNPTGAKEVTVILNQSGTTTPFSTSTEGYAFDINLTFKATEIEAIASVTDWTTGGEADVDVE